MTDVTPAYVPDPEMDHIHGDSDEITMLRRLVELYQAGAVIEYHDMPDEKAKRFHVGFRYNCMSDDDYFESQELERRLGVKDNANHRGDPVLRR
ncbi:hypothetical protein BAJUN_00960 [Bajunvirus bajun]|uniref:Uncharacterized protein n=1 Tax=Brevundimonas phage vB_BgoS-Bajun TaxID=2948594 RepID=A0A9E7N4G6_9CAUD|nr:hypothetical protein BAJUN_00960 [Brevundimonas phage vB_BgoS-Bajun]